MKPMKIAIVIAAFGAALSLGSPSAHAEGIATSPAALSPAVKTSLEQDIAAYRLAHPEAFEAVRQVKGHRPEVYQHFRNPIPLVGRELRALGPWALLPMLNALAFEAPPRENLTDAEWTALAAGMIEAVGVLRDPRSGPVLRAIFGGSSTSEPVLRMTAEAMGRLCGDPELAVLKKHAAAKGSRKIPAIFGLGECKRIESAKELAALLAAGPDDATAEALGSALGAVSSSWAWKALGPSHEATAGAVREIATRALVQGFVRYGGQVRSRIQKSILLAEHPAAIELIDRARLSAGAEAAAALDALRLRIEQQRRR